MRTTLVIVLSTVLTAGAFAANRLSAQTTGTSESGVPPASTVVTQDPAAPLSPGTTPPAPGTTTPEPTATPTTPTTPTDGSAPIAAGTASVQNIVEITRLVPAGTTAVNAFTVPAGVVLILTDLVMTNTGTTATCGGAVNRTGTTTAAPPTTPTTPTTPSPTTETETTDSTTPAIPGSAVTTTVAGTLTQTDSTVTGPLCVPAQTTTVLPLTTGIEFAAGQSVQLVNTSDAAAGATPAALGFHLRGLLVTLT